MIHKQTKRSIVRENLSELDCEFLHRLFIKSGALSRNIPSNPDIVYKNKGWKGWFDWLNIPVENQIRDASYEASDRQKLTRHLLTLKVQGEGGV